MCGVWVDGFRININATLNENKVNSGGPFYDKNQLCRTLGQVVLQRPLAVQILANAICSKVSSSLSAKEFVGYPPSTLYDTLL